MENLNKAIVMAGHVMIFIVALSTGIFLYQTLIAAQESILLSSEEYSREAEHVRENLETKREITGSEVLNYLVSRIESNGFYGKDVVVKCGSTTIKSSDDDFEKKVRYSTNLKSLLMGDDPDNEYKYEVSYDYSGDELSMVTYTLHN